jgi:hypothetical protein
MRRINQRVVPTHVKPSIFKIEGFFVNFESSVLDKLGSTFCPLGVTKRLVVDAILYRRSSYLIQLHNMLAAPL